MSKAIQVAVDLIERMPEGSTTADIMAELYFKEQVDGGLKDVRAGRVIRHELLKGATCSMAKHFLLNFYLIANHPQL